MGKYFRRERGTYICLWCPYKNRSFIGMQTHVRKHKRELEGQDAQSCLTDYAVEEGDV